MKSLTPDDFGMKPVTCPTCGEGFHQFPDRSELPDRAAMLCGRCNGWALFSRDGDKEAVSKIPGGAYAGSHLEAFLEQQKRGGGVFASAQVWKKLEESLLTKVEAPEPPPVLGPRNRRERRRLEAQRRRR